MKQHQDLYDTISDASLWILREISRSKYRKSFESEDHTTLDEISKEAEHAGIHVIQFLESLKELSTESSSTLQQKAESLFYSLNESLQALTKVTEQLLGLNCHEELSRVEKDDGQCVHAALIVEMARYNLNCIEGLLSIFKKIFNGDKLLQTTKELQQALLDYPRRPCRLVKGAPITFEQLSSKLEQLGYVKKSSNTDVLGYFFADTEKGFFRMALREGVTLKIDLNRGKNSIKSIKEITSQKKSGFSRLSKSIKLKTIETKKETITLQSADFLKMKGLVSGYLSDYQVKQDKKAQMILDHMCLGADRDIEAVWDQAPIKALSLHLVAYCVKESSNSQEAWQPMSVLISKFFLSARTFSLSDQDYKPYPKLMLDCCNRLQTISKPLSYEESLLECSRIIEEVRGTSQIVSQSVEHVASPRVLADESAARDVVGEIVDSSVSSSAGEDAASAPVLAN
ncbi:MAG: hypothetical protein CMF51_00560, partial [Legionellales bacterium]|nr:hypothetical protein [Legionellales bacterium]